MFMNPDPYIQRLMVQERHADMHRAAHRARQRRDARRTQRARRRGPATDVR